MASENLIFPVYINQRAVFDFVATMQDGIATVTRSTIIETEDQSRKSEASGSFGLGAAMSNFFKIDARAGQTKSDAATSHNESQTDRYQTPTSLLARLIATLRDTGELKTFNSIDSVSVGQLIEFEAVLSRNPMVETLDNALQGWNLFFGLQEHRGKNTQTKGKPQLTTRVDPSTEFGVAVAQHLLQDLQKGMTTDIVSSELAAGTRAVLTLEREFLSDPSMANLVEGTFRVLGKVIRTIKEKDEGIRLLRNSSLGKLNKTLLQGFVESVHKLEEFVATNKAELEIKGPAIHILPIAIYS